MKISKDKSIEMLVALGFTKAATWDDDKLKDRLGKLPTKVAEDEVPEEHRPLYRQIADSDPKDVITFGGEKSAKAEKAAKPAKAAKAEKAAKPAKAAKAEKAAKEKKEKKPATPAKTIERDAYGNKIGSISNKVNEVLTDEFKKEEDIAKEAGVTLDQARGRLYYATQSGLLEMERCVMYRFKKGATKK